MMSGGAPDVVPASRELCYQLAEADSLDGADMVPAVAGHVCGLRMAFALSSGRLIAEVKKRCLRHPRNIMAGYKIVDLGFLRR